MRLLKIVSLFAGCGGLDLGFDEANKVINGVRYKAIWANDINQSACDTYENYFGKHIVCKDIWDINVDTEIPPCDIVLGGFPCQDFSVLWKRGGIETERGNLYRAFSGIVERKQPLAFVAENVKGLLSANKGQAIEQIKEDFAAKGYHLTCHLYNAANYGVPQLRERIIMVGIRNDAVFKEQMHLKDKTPVMFPIMTPTHLKNHISAGDALKDAETVLYNNEKINIKSRTKEIISMISPGGNFTDIPKDSDLYVKGMISHVYRRLHPDKPSTTIIAAGGGGTWGYHYSEPRPLTNRERARIQSFPDTFQFLGTVAEVRRQIGNAVPPKLGEAVAVNLANLLNEVVFTREIALLEGMDEVAVTKESGLRVG